MNRIGIDLGGTKIEGILTTDDPMDVLVRKRVSTEQDKGYAPVSYTHLTLPTILRV